MTTPSTRDQIRKRLADTLETLRLNGGALREFARGRRFRPEALHLDLEVALRLFDSLSPPTPPADPIDALRVALDYGMGREWPLDLREALARTLPELKITTRWWVDEGDDVGNRYDAVTGRVVGRVRRGVSGLWRATLPEECPAAVSLEGAQADVDEQLSGWVLGGGAVGRPVSGTNASCGTCAGEGVVRGLTPPEEEQPDASWLRHVRPDDNDVRMGWVYEGETSVPLAAHPSGVIPLLAWLSARDLLIGEPERFGRDGAPWVRIVTRAPLDGDWCASCGENMDGARFLSSRQRIVRGEESTVCGSCAEDSDGGWP